MVAALHITFFGTHPTFTPVRGDVKGVEQWVENSSEQNEKTRRLLSKTTCTCKRGSKLDLHVPPSRAFSMTPTFFPYEAARFAEAMPPDPPPITR